MKKGNFKNICILTISIISLACLAFLNSVDMEENVLGTTSTNKEMNASEEKEEAHMSDVYFLINIGQKIKNGLSAH